MLLGNRISGLFVSIKLALFLIIALIAGTVLGVTVSQEVFSSWWFLTLIVLLFVNTFCCTLRQWARIRKKSRRSGAAYLIRAAKFKEQLEIGEKFDFQQTMRTIEEILTRQRYRVSKKPTKRGHFIGGRKLVWGQWGIVIFHVGLLVIIIGGFLTFTTSFWGSFLVLKGMVFTDNHENYVAVKQGPFYPKDHRNFQIQLDDVLLEYNELGELRDYTAAVTILENGKEVKHGIVSGPTPLEYKGLILYKKLYGYAPGMTIISPDDQETKFRVMLDTTMHGENIRHEGDFRIPGTVLDVNAVFYPDLDYAAQDSLDLKAHHLNNPGLVLTINKGGKALYREQLPLNEGIEFEGYYLSFDNFLPWYGFSAVKDRGISVVFAGFWIVLLGAAIIYLLVPRQIGIRVEEGYSGLSLTIYGSTGKYPNLFEEEFDKLVNTLKSELGKGGIIK